MIIDCQGHYTAPEQLAQWRDRRVAAVGDPVNALDPAELVISDEQIRESIGRDTELPTQVIPAGSILSATPHLSDGQRQAVYETNVRRVYPRLDARLKAQGR